MEEEPTGNQTATYLSGYGLSAENFERKIRDSIERDMWESFQTELLEEEEMEIVEEILGSSDTLAWGVEAFVDPLVKRLGQMKTDAVWKKFKDRVVFSRKLADEAARRRWELREVLVEKSKELKETSLPQIMEAKIERPQWKKENLDTYLEQVLKEAEIEYVVAVAEVGLPGHFSNSVAADIREIGKSVLDRRKEEAGEVYILGLVKDRKERLMMIGNNNPVVKLCIEGAQAEFQGQPDRAHSLYRQAWDMDQDDYEACIAAHYLARNQKDLPKKLHWNQVALEKAIAVGDRRTTEFFPSLYLSLGESFELLGNKNEAQRYYALAAELGIVHGESDRTEKM